LKQLGRVIAVPGDITCLAFSSDGKNIACCSREMNAAYRKSRTKARVSGGPLLSSEEQPDYHISYCTVYDVESRSPIGHRHVSRDTIYSSAAFSPDSSAVLLNKEDNHISAIDVYSGLTVVPSPPQRVEPLPIAYSLSGERLPISSYAGLLQAYWQIVKEGRQQIWE